MTQWLFDTFVWTGALIALVLVLRRPVARHFGPQVAYAMWALPLARLVLPPLVLPASMAPVEAAPAEPLVILLADAPQAAAVAPALGWLPVLALALWLGGAALMLAWRARDYFAMRRDLLAEARPMGEAGSVRLVETPAVDSPVAFGLRDKVVALPPGFMVQPDRAARDLAIAHELAHHSGHDLLANLAAQPLLALHWFNPLAWAGWRAMRRDQEAACDARVVAGREWHERAAYAEVIAGFAAGRRLALAAPMASSMACPLLGEKAIIHRLRSLTMTDVSSARRKLGLSAIGAGALLALPLTASISYARVEAPEAPEAEALATSHNVVRNDRETSHEATVADSAENGEVVTALSDAEIDRMMARIDADMARVDEEASRAAAEGREAARFAMREIPQVETGCQDGSDIVTHRQLADGRWVMVICQRAAHLEASTGLREAQRAILEAEGMPPELRARILKELEAEISSLGREQAMWEAAVRTLAAMELMEAMEAAQFVPFTLPLAPAPPLPPAVQGVRAPLADPAPVVLIRATVMLPTVKVIGGPTI
ncbi:M56 family metallopeptidase [Altererythrobacter sp. KTW20L]|uniref:M56 family metallopeptidase n=1 Tax=Altererythrobacter sp. KTW20L TaxID=2942210 RepID=UPI0020BF3DB2|nr:M56 family metallopeptidase [Altererythrobacter sp. KTW20L]MCL6252102.1 M56 family metallopeptidase [Altererythrobacter sp. KTW20L]